MRLVCLAAAASRAACFGPRLNGEISCEANGLCPPGLGCFDGVIQLTARVSIEVTGIIEAGGEGGINGALIDGGGGGGGSGGYIGLDAPAIALTGATVVANGGGGGEGADDTTAGAPGDDGSRDDNRAQGGSGGADGGSDGGDGASRDNSGQSVGGVPTGGGGGGGGGFVLTRGALDASGGIVSPAPRPLSNAGSN